MGRAFATIAALVLLVGCAATSIGGKASVQPGATPGQPTIATPTDETTPSSTSTSTSTAETTSSSASSSSSASTSSNSGSSSSSSSETSTSSSLPAGFTGWDDDLAFRPVPGKDLVCSDDQVNGCYGVDVFSAAGCPGGAKVDLTFHDADDNVIGEASGSTDAIDAGAIERVVIGDTTESTGAHLKDLSC